MMDFVKFNLKVLLLILLVEICILEQMVFRQEAAKILYVNKKYMKNVSVFTFRPNRHSNYLTNIYGTNLHPWGKNITIIFDYSNLRVKSETYEVRVNLCELFKWDWIKAFVKRFSNIPIDKCPVPSGNYYCNAFDLPSKNLPVPISEGDYYVKLMFLLNPSNERIGLFSMNLRYEKRRKSKN